MTVTAGGGTTSLTVTRGQSYNDGQNNTIATTHASGAQVQRASFTAFTSTGAVRGTWLESIDGNFIHLYENKNQPLQPHDYVTYQFAATAASSGTGSSLPCLRGLAYPGDARLDSGVSSGRRPAVRRRATRGHDSRSADHQDGLVMM